MIVLMGVRSQENNLKRVGRSVKDSYVMVCIDI